MTKGLEYDSIDLQNDIHGALIGIYFPHFIVIHVDI